MPIGQSTVFILGIIKKTTSSECQGYCETISYNILETFPREAGGSNLGRGFFPGSLRPFSQSAEQNVSEEPLMREIGFENFKPNEFLQSPSEMRKAVSDFFASQKRNTKQTYLS